MARNPQEIEKEIRRIEGQLLVAKQICRENVWRCSGADLYRCSLLPLLFQLQEINQLKQEQETNDVVLQETNRLLAMKSLHTEEHVDQFNQLVNDKH